MYGWGVTFFVPAISIFLRWCAGCGARTSDRNIERNVVDLVFVLFDVLRDDMS